MRQLGQKAITTGSGVLIYTVPTGMEVTIQDFMIANTTASPITCSLHLVPVSVAVGDSNAVMKEVQIAPHTTVHWCGNQHMTAGGFLQAIGSISGLTITVSGTELRKGGAL
jgi:hypothetical protein